MAQCSAPSVHRTLLLSAQQQQRWRRQEAPLHPRRGKRSTLQCQANMGKWFEGASTIAAASLKLISLHCNSCHYDLLCENFIQGCLSLGPTNPRLSPWTLSCLSIQRAGQRSTSGLPRKVFTHLLPYCCTRASSCKCLRCLYVLSLV